MFFKKRSITVTKSRRMRWARHVARKKRLEMHAQFYSGNPKGTNHIGDLSVGGRIILEQVFIK
jgi:hypothetical protein